MFDDDHAVADAGLALVGVLNEMLGLEVLAEDGRKTARPSPGGYRPKRLASTQSGSPTAASSKTSFARCRASPVELASTSWRTPAGLSRGPSARANGAVQLLSSAPEAPESPGYSPDTAISPVLARVREHSAR
jgi:hypothetical protein